MKFGCGPVPYRAYGAVARETGTMCLAHKTLIERISDSISADVSCVCARVMLRTALQYVVFSGCVGAARIYSRAPPASRGGFPMTISQKIHGTGGTGTD